MHFARVDGADGVLHTRRHVGFLEVRVTFTRDCVERNALLKQTQVPRALGAAPQGYPKCPSGSTVRRAFSQQSWVYGRLDWKRQTVFLTDEGRVWIHFLRRSTSVAPL